tara:strand:+ start:853 stop:2406 length:1554 start_codon:yes stop_codon:yes gene_type:complete
MNNKNISKEIQVLINQFNVKNFNLVISKGKSLIKKNPEYVILYNLVGSAYQNVGNFKKAKENFKFGLKLDPKNIALLNNLAMSHKNLLEYKLSERIYLNIINQNKKYINAFINLGNLKRDLNKFEEAIDLYKKALNIDDKNPVIYYSLALAYQGIGNFEKAINYSKKVLDISPKFSQASHLISQSKKFTDRSDEDYLELKNKLIDITENSLAKVDVYFSLAKAEEDLGNIKEATNYLIKGNKIKKELINYNVSNEINLLKDIENKFKIISTKKNKNYEREKVIFILGMPRSGTSLVEQIITSHSEVFGGGELPILSNIVKENFINDKVFLIDDLKEKIEDPIILNKVKLDYLNFLEDFDFKEKFVTDKAPLNFRWIGFINAIFPNAKIIHCTRDPKNNCLSMFKNLFEGGLNFTYDQMDLTIYYKKYLDLMNFWTSKYPEKIFEIKYENLISNSKEEIKKIIDFCDLKWEDNCLLFHKNKTPIKTMSTAQARKPIYKSSLNQFDKFKEYLPVIEKEL